MEKIGIACDHAGYEMKEFLVGYLGALGYEVLDFGTHSGLCGSGEGMATTLNKHRGIRAGLAWEPEIAGLIRRHNDANVIVFPARFITNDEAAAMLDIFLATEFEGGRHERRIAKIPAGCA